MIMSQRRKLPVVHGDHIQTGVDSGASQPAPSVSPPGPLARDTFSPSEMPSAVTTQYEAETQHLADADDQDHGVSADQDHGASNSLDRRTDGGDAKELEGDGEADTCVGQGPYTRQCVAGSAMQAWMDRSVLSLSLRVRAQGAK